MGSSLPFFNEEKKNKFKKRMIFFSRDSNISDIAFTVYIGRFVPHLSVECCLLFLRPFLFFKII